MYEFAKKLVALRCDAILNERLPKCNYVKLEERDKRIRCAKCKICNPDAENLRTTKYFM